MSTFRTENSHLWVLSSSFGDRSVYPSSPSFLSLLTLCMCMCMVPNVSTNFERVCLTNLKFTTAGRPTWAETQWACQASSTFTKSDPYGDPLGTWYTTFPIRRTLTIVFRASTTHSLRSRFFGTIFQHHIWQTVSVILITDPPPKTFFSLFGRFAENVVCTGISAFEGIVRSIWNP